MPMHTVTTVYIPTYSHLQPIELLRQMYPPKRHGAHIAKPLQKYLIRLTYPYASPIGFTTVNYDTPQTIRHIDYFQAYQITTYPDAIYSVELEETA